MTATEIKALITLLWTRVGADRVSSADLREVGNALVDFTSGNTNNIAAWDADETYATDGILYAEDNNRIWKTKQDDNIGNQPPQDTGITEDTWWIEVSPGKNMDDWAPGLYGEGLVLVFYNDSIYKLLAPVRPYESTDIVAEIAAGEWKDLIHGNLIKTPDEIVNIEDLPATYIFQAGQAVTANLPEGTPEIVNKPLRYFTEANTPVTFHGDGDDPIYYNDPWQVGADISGVAIWDGAEWKFT